MLTPKFSLRQNADFLFIQLHVPYIKTENAECDANGDEFYFSAKPYYLRLHLPGNIVNDDRLKSQYDVDKGDLNIRVAKEVPGENFDGLDMITKLLTPKNTIVMPNIEVVETQDDIGEKHSDTCHDEGLDSDLVPDDGISAEEFDFDWFIEQKVPDVGDIKINKGNIPSYGFANKKHSVIGGICSEIDVIDLKDPDNVPVSQRTVLRQQQEDYKFDCEHYLADLFDDDLIQGVISSNYPILIGAGSDSEGKFTEAEKERLLRLPRRKYLIDHDTRTQVCLGLVDLIYAYSYNYRFCGGESNVESDWTICKLSATLSWLESFHNLKDVAICCARRTLCFPLYRSWKLFGKVFSDMKQIFKAGKCQILKCLLGIHSILETSENHYLLNDLYITDYCVWLQTVDSHLIDSLSSSLAKLEILKSDVGLSITDIETDADNLMSEHLSDEEDVNELSKKMMNAVHVTDVDCVDSDDGEDDSDCDETNDDDEDDDSDDDGEDDDDEEEGKENDNGNKKDID